MNNLLDNQENDDSNGRRDREITLGTATVLGIFFGLAILCAAFFAFGYSLGSKHSSPTLTASGDPLTRPLSTVKPSPGSPINSAGKTIAVDPAIPPPAESVTTIKAPVTAAPGSAAPPEAFEPDQPLPKPPRTPPPAPAPITATPFTVPAGQFVVQVTALTRQEDAEMIATSLERKGYAVAIRNEPNDKLFHVQLGPFPTRKDAEAMRQRVLADGFNAYIK